MTNGMATVTIDGLACGVNYTITAGGTFNGQLVGSRSSNESNDANHRPCPPVMITTIATNLTTVAPTLTTIVPTFSMTGKEDVVYCIDTTIM